LNSHCSEARACGETKRRTGLGGELHAFPTGDDGGGQAIPGDVHRGACHVQQRVHAQQTPADPVAALLVEVRELRIAMERLASATPRMQLLTSRLTIQEERANRASRDLEGVRSELENIRTEIQALRMQAKMVEDSLPREAEPRQREELERQKHMLATRLETLAAREQFLRNREAEAIGIVGQEQARWQELSSRLDELERALEGRK